MASGRISRVLLKCRSFSSRQFRLSCLVQGLRCSFKLSMQELQLYSFAGLCSPGKSMFAWPKMIAPSLPKLVRPFVDGSDVATRGLSIGVLSASTIFQNRH